MRIARALPVSLALYLSAAPLLAIAQDTAAPPAPAAAPSFTGLYLTTKYPSFTLQAGTPATIDLTLRDYGLPPTVLNLAIEGVPQGWTATILGGGQPVGSATAIAGADTALQLRIAAPADAQAGTASFTVKASGNGQTLTLPLTAMVGQELPAKLTLTSNLPALRGSATSPFKYKLKIENDSGHDTVVALAAQGPAGFDTSFAEAYGSQQITSIPVAAGKSADVDFTVTPPRDVAGGDYPIAVRVVSDEASADLTVGASIVGQPRLSIVGDDGRLSGTATAGEASTINLALANHGTEDAQNVELTGTAPSGWTVTFDPKTVPDIPAGGTQPVVATITPTDKAIAGDYQASFKANGAAGASASADFRITVDTSTRWGLVGIAIIAIAVLVVVATVLRFGRR